LRFDLPDGGVIDNSADAGTAALSGLCNTAADRRAARFVGAGGNGMVLKTLFVEDSDNKKAALMSRRLDG
jgi:hypothetical protein